MVRPNTKQWAILWAACAWTVLALVVAESYVVRAVFGGWLVAGLAYWQLASCHSRREEASADLGTAAQMSISPEGKQASLLPWFGLFVVAICAVGTFASANDSDPQAIWAFGMLVSWYALFCYSLARVARTLNVERRWRAWVPIFQWTLLTDLARVSQAWVVVLLMPMLAVFVHAWLWGRILPRLGTSAWWAGLIWIPVLNAPLLAYAASARPIPSEVAAAAV